MDEKPMESSGNFYKDRLRKKSAEPKTEEHAGAGGDNAIEHLGKVHSSANGAHKSFHVYAHPDGKLHAHAHDHQAKTQEHREHVSMADVEEHMRTHLPEEKQEIMEEREGEQAEPQAGGMEQLGM